MKRGVSSALMVVYWAALPLSALVTVALAFVFFMPGGQTISGPPTWLSLLLSSAMTLLIIWRLWTHERARKTASDASEVSRNNDD